MSRQSIIAEAKRNYELVYDINQRHTIQYRQSQRDFCAGLSIKWLALRNAGQDYPYDDATKLVTDPGQEPLDIQDVYETQGHARAFAAVKLRKDSELSTEIAVAAVVRAATQPGMYFLRLRHDDNSGHAVAFRSYGWGTDARAFCYFDANLGSFYFGNAPRFQEWFAGVLREPLRGPNESYMSYYAYKWLLYRLVPMVSR